MHKVIIIEDDFRIAEINKAFVEQVKGFEVVGIALNGKTFLNMLDEHTPDLVLLDIYIPDISGKKLLLHLKEHYPQVGIIMITAAKEVKTLEFFFQQGVFDYLLKPVDAKRLHRSLQKFSMYKDKVNKAIELEQKDIDAIMDRSSASGEDNDYYPKGIDPLTLDRIVNFINGEQRDITVEEAGKALGIGISTTRRYFDYLLKIGRLEAHLLYGKVGRPIRVYRPVD